jgi:hypothetical protein
MISNALTLLIWNVNKAAAPACKFAATANTPHCLLNTIHPSVFVLYAALDGGPSPKRTPMNPASQMFSKSTLLGIFCAKEKRKQQIRKKIQLEKTEDTNISLDAIPVEIKKQIHIPNTYHLLVIAATV